MRRGKGRGCNRCKCTPLTKFMVSFDTSRLSLIWLNCSLIAISVSLSVTLLDSVKILPRFGWPPDPHRALYGHSWAWSALQLFVIASRPRFILAAAQIPGHGPAFGNMIHISGNIVRIFLESMNVLRKWRSCCWQAGNSRCLLPEYDLLDSETILLGYCKFFFNREVGEIGGQVMVLWSQRFRAVESEI